MAWIPDRDDDGSEAPVGDPQDNEWTVTRRFVHWWVAKLALDDSVTLERREELVQRIMTMIRSELRGF